MGPLKSNTNELMFIINLKRPDLIYKVTALKRV